MHRTVRTLATLALAEWQLGHDDAAARVRAPKHGTHPRHQLAQPIGLGDVVVGTHFQPDDRVDLGSLGGDHDDRDLRTLAQLAAHVDPTDLRQHHVEQHQVRIHPVEHLERLGAVNRHDDLEPLAAQSDGQGLDEARFVLDDQYDAFTHDLDSSFSVDAFSVDA